jgi:SpoVK/Ycf46/Vps4 family AAA+-type ATPase
MQERPPLVFVAATANKIESLPAEVLRKGRFDEVFFCDLPSTDERMEIFRIHLKMNGVDPDTLEIKRLMQNTEGWTGAEVEQAVVSARIEAHGEGRTLDLDDLRAQVRRIVPLSTTMVEQIRAIRSWSFHRATRASKAPPPSMLPTGS